MYLFVLLFAALYSVLVTDAHGPVAVSNCNPVPTSMASPPTLANLVGTWYVYITDFGYYKPDLRCGACQVKATSDLTRFDIQCLFIAHWYIGGSLQYRTRYMTGKMTLNTATNVFTVTGSDAKSVAVNMEFVVTHYNQVKCNLAVALCARVNGWTGHTHHVAKIGLAMSGPVSSFTDVTGSTHEIQYDGCPKATFDFTKLPGITEVDSIDSNTRTTTLKSAKVDCAGKGFTLYGTAPKQRYIQLYKTPTKNFDDAVKACEDLGFTLAMADTQEILNAMKTKLVADSIAEAWIGLRHTEQNSERATLTWYNTARTKFQMVQADASVIPPGTFLRFRDNRDGEWDRGQTSLQGHECYGLETDDTIFGWNEESCTDVKAYFCECTAC